MLRAHRQGTMGTGPHALNSPRSSGKTARSRMEVMMDTAVRSTLSRRAALRLGVGAAGVAALAAPSGARGQTAPATPTVVTPSTTPFVLVHGAWAGAWIWRKIAPLLRAAGHDVFASTATGMGDRAHLADPKFDLDLYVTDVVNLLTFENLTGVTLVGWSYGGMTITGVAERVPERIRQVVYLDGTVPADGQNSFQALGFPDQVRTAWAKAAADAGKPGYILPLVDFVRALTKDPTDLAWMLAEFVPQPMASWAQPIKLGNPAAAKLPRAYIYCTEGKGDPSQDGLAATGQRIKADSKWRYREVADTHFAPINSPQATVEALLSLA